MVFSICQFILKHGQSNVPCLWLVLNNTVVIFSHLMETFSLGGLSSMSPLSYCTYVLMSKSPKKCHKNNKDCCLTLIYNVTVFLLLVREFRGHVN